MCDKVTLCKIFDYLEALPSSRNFKEGEALLNAGHIFLCGCTTRAVDDANIFALYLQSLINNAPHEIKGRIYKKKIMSGSCKNSNVPAKQVLENANTLQLHLYHFSLKKKSSIWHCDFGEFIT